MKFIVALMMTFFCTTNIWAIGPTSDHHFGPWFCYDTWYKTGTSGYDSYNSYPYGQLSNAAWDQVQQTYDDLWGPGTAMSIQHVGKARPDSKMALYRYFICNQNVPSYTRRVLNMTYGLNTFSNNDKVKVAAALYVRDDYSSMANMYVDFTPALTNGAGSDYRISSAVNTNFSGSSNIVFDNASGSATAEKKKYMLMAVTVSNDHSSTYSGVTAGAEFSIQPTAYTITDYYTNVINYNANGGTGTMTQQVIETTGTLKDNTFTRAEYRFKGWSTSATGSVIYTNKATINVTADSKGVKNLYAVWQLLPPPTVNQTPSARTISYTGSAQALVNAGSVTGGTIEYRLGAGEWSTNVPTATAAGTYAVSYRVLPDQDHRNPNISATVNVTLKPKVVDHPTIALATESFVYDATAKSPEVTSVKDGATVIPVSEYAVSYTNNINAGTATVTITDKANGNYTVSGTKNFTIRKATLTAQVQNDTIIYGAEAPASRVVYSGWKGSDNISVLGGGEIYTCAYEAYQSNVGEYTISMTGRTADNYVFDYKSGKLVVNPKPASNADMSAAQVEGEALMYNARPNKPTLNVLDKERILEEGKDFTLTFKGSNPVYTESEIAPFHAGDYTVVVNYIQNYTGTKELTYNIARAPLTATALNKTVIYGDEHPEFTVRYTGWKGSDREDVLTGTLAFATPYIVSSPIGTYSITASGMDAADYIITYVEGTLTVIPATVYISGAEAYVAKFVDGTTPAVVTKPGEIIGIKCNDPLQHVTTAAFDNAEVAEGKIITFTYALEGDAALLANYDLYPTTEVFTTRGFIIEQMLPDNNHEAEAMHSSVKEGIEVYGFGYCEGSGYSLNYHLNSGYPDQYRIDYADNRFEDVDWTDLEVGGRDGIIDMLIPADLPTGDYQMTVYFRDSRFTWLESKDFQVTFHVNLPETYTQPLFNNTIALVDTCECFTDIQWYHRANSSQAWQAIEGANGFYHHIENDLTGEYFVSVKMNGVQTFTCPQIDMRSLYQSEKKMPGIIKANPSLVQDRTLVSIENMEGDSHILRVVNISGVEVLNTTFEGNETMVEMSSYLPGNYMISVDGITVKVLKK